MRNWFARYNIGYIQDKNIFVCPSMRNDETAVTFNIAPQFPSNVGREDYTVGYTAQEAVIGNLLVYSRASAKLSNLQYFLKNNQWPAILIADGYYRINGNGNWGPESYMGTGAGRGRYRHDRRANFLIADGSVGALEAEFVYLLPANGRYLTPSSFR